MLTVDLSNIWGRVALPELLALEPELSAAHLRLLGLEEGQEPPAWKDAPLTQGESLRAILTAAEAIRKQSDLCLVLAPRGLGLGAWGVIHALGLETSAPKLLFAGDSFSTRAQSDLLARLEGKDFSLILLSPQGLEPEFAAALRAFRWMLERKHGTQEAARRIYAVTGPDSGLDQTAREQGWHRFPLPPEGPFSCEGAGWLLPMAVAGVDISAFLAGAGRVREENLLASFENPLWLHAGVRALMGRRGLGRELLATQEPGLWAFGQWWQSLFPENSGTLLLPRESLPQPGAFVTALRPETPERPLFLDADWKNRDGLGHLEGKPLDTLEEALWQAAFEQADRGSPVLTVDCGPVAADTLGELAAFFGLSRGLCRLLQPEGEDHPLGQALARVLDQKLPEKIEL